MADIKDIDEMSDEELLNMAPPEIEEDTTQNNTTEPSENNTTGSEPQNTPSEPDEEDNGNEAEEGSNSEETDEQSEETEESEQSTQNSEPAVNYEEFYKTIMSPIKANGKSFQPRTPEEAIRLMQMGANYTQKMQGIAPYRKKIQMLQKANLLEDEKLNFLIDVAQGNPEAIKKLLKDSKVDPLDLDTSSNTNYIPSNHTVSDEEVQIQSIVDDLKSTPEGIETLRQIQGMDQASLSAISQTPSMMSTLHEQRQNGVYDLIMKEMEHQEALGNIPAGTPFLEKYKAVGDYCLQLQQRQKQAMANLPRGTIQKSSNPSSANVKGAAPSGRSRKPAQTVIDPFSLSDEEFEKQFKDYNF